MQDAAAGVTAVAAAATADDAAATAAAESAQGGADRTGGAAPPDAPRAAGEQPEPFFAQKPWAAATFAQHSARVAFITCRTPIASVICATASSPASAASV